MKACGEGARRLFIFGRLAVDGEAISEAGRDARG
jgi:hypothetical protein